MKKKELLKKLSSFDFLDFQKLFDEYSKKMDKLVAEYSKEDEVLKKQLTKSNFDDLRQKRMTLLNKNKLFFNFEKENLDFRSMSILQKNFELTKSLLDRYKDDDEPPLLLEVPDKIKIGCFDYIFGQNFGDQKGNVILELSGRQILLDIISWQNDCILIKPNENLMEIPPDAYGEIFVLTIGDVSSNKLNIMVEPIYHFITSTSETWYAHAICTGYSKNKNLYSPIIPEYFQFTYYPYELYVNADENVNVYVIGGPYYDGYENKYYVRVHAGDERAVSMRIFVVFTGLVPQGFNIPDGWEDMGIF